MRDRQGHRRGLSGDRQADRQTRNDECACKTKSPRSRCSSVDCRLLVSIDRAQTNAGEAEENRDHPGPEAAVPGPLRRRDDGAIRVHLFALLVAFVSWFERGGGLQSGLSQDRVSKGLARRAKAERGSYHVQAECSRRSTQTLGESIR